jgi:hypothetical protein
MTQLSTGVAVIAQSTFGRDSAMFESLLGFVAQLSVVLWAFVILTVVIRFVGIGMYRRGARRRAARTTLVEAAVPGAGVPAAAVPTITAVIDLVQPGASQLTDAGLLRPGLFGSTAAEKDAVLVPAEFVDVLTADAVTNATFGQVLQPAGAPAAVAASVKVPRRATRSWRAETRSAAHMPALASNSTEA